MAEEKHERMKEMMNEIEKKKFGEMKKTIVRTKEGDVSVYSVEVDIGGEGRTLTLEVGKNSMALMLADRDGNIIEYAKQAGNHIDYEEPAGYYEPSFSD
jgi:hypothetical protein